MREAAKIGWAWLRSWRKPVGSWVLDDYPVRARTNGWSPERGKGELEYLAQVLNWPGIIGMDKNA